MHSVLKVWPFTRRDLSNKQGLEMASLLLLVAFDCEAAGLSLSTFGGAPASSCVSGALTDMISACAFWSFAY